ncbi:MAG: STAS domain-containing protein [Bryobacteraceae bacterium]
MILDINQRQVEPDLVVVEMKGRITLGRESQRLETVIRELLDAGVRRVVFDMSGVDYADSSGLGILTFCFATMKKSGGALRFANPTGRLQELFRFTMLDKVFAIFPNVDDATRDFKL